MKTKNFAYYEKQLRECADLAELEYQLKNSDLIGYLLHTHLVELVQDIKEKRTELLNGLLESIGKTPF